MRRLVLLPAAALAALASASCSPEAGEPVVGTWTLTGAMNEPRWLHSLVSLSDGRVLAAGGCADYWEEPPPARCRALDSAEVWDPVTGIWTPTGSMNEPRAAAGAVLLGDGRVLVAGGWDGLPYSTSSTSDYTAELYDPNQGLWTRTGSMAWRRERDGASPPNIVLLPTGKVLFANGMTMDRSAVASAAEVYDPARGAWEPTGPMVVPRLASTAILLPSGKVLVVGGGTVVPPPNPVIPATARSELYDPETNAWTETKGSLRRPVIWNTLALLPTGEVLLTNGLPQVYNGIDPTCRFNAEADIYDPVTEEWRPAHPMLNAHSYPSAVRLPSGRVLLAGGGLHPGCFTSLSMFPSEVYDPWHDAWAPTPPLRHFEFGAAAAVLLQSGQVLFTGGETTDFMPWTHWDTLSAAQIFDEGPLPEAVP